MALTQKQISRIDLFCENFGIDHTGMDLEEVLINLQDESVSIPWQAFSTDDLKLVIKQGAQTMGDHTKLSMEVYEEMLKFLDIAQNVYNEKSKSMSDIDKKLEYCSKKNRIDKARQALRALTFEMEDYVKTGKFEACKIITKLVGKEKDWVLNDDNKILATWDDRGFYTWCFVGTWANEILSKFLTLESKENHKHQDIDSFRIKALNGLLNCSTII